MPAWALAIAAIAAFRFVVAMVLYLAGQPTAIDLPLPAWAYSVFASVFAALGGLLMTGNERDARAGWLGGVFLLLTTPTAPTTLASTAAMAWLVHVRPDSFFPLFLWRFVDVFPSRASDTMSARLAQALSVVAGVVGVLAFATNFSFALFPTADLAADPRALLAAGPRIRQSWYWLFTLMPAIAAFSYLMWKAWASRPDDRRRVLLFVAAVFSGMLPFGIQVALEQSIPAYREFSHSLFVEPLIGVALFTSLATVPFSTAYLVLFERIVELRFVLRLTYQYILARYSLVAFTTIPFIALGMFIWDRRAEPVASFLVGGRPIALLVAGGVGVAALRVRETWIDRLSHRYFRESYDAREVLARLVSGFQVDSIDELTEVIRRELDVSLHANVEVFYADDLDATLQHSAATLKPLSLQSTLVLLAMSDAQPMAVDVRTQPALQRLPPNEREWLEQGAFEYLVCLRSARGRCAGVLALSAKRSEQAYSSADRTLLATISSAAGLAVDNLRLRSTRPLTPEPAAGECLTCARIVDGGLLRCPKCGGGVGPSQVPLVLRGTYQLVERIGAGGMGIVYRATDLLLARDVAIKTLPAVTPERVTRLREEARAMASVSHPNLAVAYGIEMWNERPLLLVEYLHGGTLRDRLAHQPLPPAAALDVGIRIAEALEELHGSGLVHCDIKPSNIGYTKSGALKLLDFGLARLIRALDVSAITVTLGHEIPERTAVSEHGVAGTPYYMSPEAIQGARPTPAFDLWAVAIVVYEALTGKRPFEGRDARQVFENVGKGVIPPVHTTERAHAIAINKWFRRELALEKSARSQDAAAFGYALRVLRSSIG